MTPTGLEQPAKLSGKTHFAEQGGAESGAVGARSCDFDPESVDAGLAVVVAAWPGLSVDERAAVLALVRRAVGDAGGAVGD